MAKAIYTKLRWSFNFLEDLIIITTFLNYSCCFLVDKVIIFQNSYTTDSLLKTTLRNVSPNSSKLAKKHNQTCQINNEILTDQVENP